MTMYFPVDAKVHSSLRFVSLLLLGLSSLPTDGLAQDGLQCKGPFGQMKGEPIGSDAIVYPGKSVNICVTIPSNQEIDAIRCTTQLWPPNIEENIYYVCQSGADCKEGGTFVQIKRNSIGAGKDSVCATFKGGTVNQQDPKIGIKSK